MWRSMIVFATIECLVEFNPRDTQMYRPPMYACLPGRQGAPIKDPLYMKTWIFDQPYPFTPKFTRYKRQTKA
jgi:hypothetical protein